MGTAWLVPKAVRESGDKTNLDRVVLDRVTYYRDSLDSAELLAQLLPGEELLFGHRLAKNYSSSSISGSSAAAPFTMDFR